MRELRIAAIAAITFTVLLGIAYPLVVTGASQVVFPGRADGSFVRAGGRVVGSRLIGQDFKRDRGAFQSRPSVTGYAPDATLFNNQGPNQEALAKQLKGNVSAYLKREGPSTPGLTAAGIPADAVTTSASGVDPDISIANARIQANRVARVKRLPLATVRRLIDGHAHRPLFGLAGTRSVNVLELNLAVAREAAR
jgi:K+-transporting ATPase ATPase C chain